MLNSHIVTSYDTLLNALYKQIYELGCLSKEALENAVLVFVKNDNQKAQEVIDNTYKFDDFEVDIKDRVIKLLALRQPVADDLSFVVNSLKISSELIRIGELARSIAIHKMNMTKDIHPNMSFTITQMETVVQKMISLSLEALDQNVQSNCPQVTQMDEEVNIAYNSLFRELLTYMMENAETIESCTHLMFISRNLERAGDHAKNVARCVDVILSA